VCLWQKNNVYDNRRTRLTNICLNLFICFIFIVFFFCSLGEEHYNIISALHKSMRGSDASAALYWLARMMEGGENPLYVARRLIRFASEDIGMSPFEFECEFLVYG
jgi:replication-associated recombination protein RarA